LWLPKKLCKVEVAIFLDGSEEQSCGQSAEVVDRLVDTLLGEGEHPRDGHHVALALGQQLLDGHGLEETPGEPGQRTVHPLLEVQAGKQIPQRLEGEVFVRLFEVVVEVAVVANDYRNGAHELGSGEGVDRVGGTGQHQGQKHQRPSADVDKVQRNLRQTK